MSFPPQPTPQGPGPQQDPGHLAGSGHLGVPGTTENPQLPTRSDDPHNHALRTRQRTGKYVNIILATLLVLTLAVTGYLIYLSRSWAAQSEALDEISTGLGVQVAQLQAELKSTTDSLDVSQEQLAKAQKRITELASEKALVGDDRESQRIIAQDTAQVANEALTVSGKLGDCITAQNLLTTLTGNAQSEQNKLIQELAKESPDAEVVADLNTKLRTFRNEITEQQPVTEDTCNGAIDRYNDLLTDLKDS